MNEKIMRKAGFSEEMDLIKEGKCPQCGKPINRDNLRNEISKREFDISGLCQECQDSVFGKD